MRIQEGISNLNAYAGKDGESSDGLKIIVLEKPGRALPSWYELIYEEDNEDVDVQVALYDEW